MSFVKACASSEIPSSGGKAVEINGQRIALFRVEGKLLAIDDKCTHDEASLADGGVTTHDGQCIVECPWHGATFDLCTGKALTLPAVTPVKTYAVREQNGVIEVNV
jgi:3-phenylpropionate/trans-cinnamate dioxygenase ferredoxin subunit